jgi:uncharacterized Zn finger protein
MAEPAGQQLVACPHCSPAEPVVHTVLAAGAGAHTVRCDACAHVHKVQPSGATTIERPVIISQEGESTRTVVPTTPAEPVACGDEFIVDTDAAIMQVRVTAIEDADGRRVEAATMADVRTLWTRAVDNVRVNVTVHPPDGRDRSHSATVRLPGEFALEVGATLDVDDAVVTVSAVRIRDAVTDYRHRTYDHPGDAVFAKDVQRVYAVADRRDPWSVW